MNIFILRCNFIILSMKDFNREITLLESFNGSVSGAFNISTTFPYCVFISSTISLKLFLRYDVIILGVCLILILSSTSNV